MLSKFGSLTSGSPDVNHATQQYSKVISKLLANVCNNVNPVVPSTCHTCVSSINLAAKIQKI